MQIKDAGSFFLNTSNHLLPILGKPDLIPHLLIHLFKYIPGLAQSAVGVCPCVALLFNDAAKVIKVVPLTLS